MTDLINILNNTTFSNTKQLIFISQLEFNQLRFILTKNNNYYYIKKEIIFTDNNQDFNLSSITFKFQYQDFINFDKNIYSKNSLFKFLLSPDFIFQVDYDNNIIQVK